jgi:response regulator RpfG family c-di-GMP phosphodiesterase
LKDPRGTILIVDDQELNRTLLRGIFEDSYELEEAVNGEEAMELVRKLHTKLAAVLLDIVMPKKDGYQVLKEIGAEGYFQEFPVVIITAENSTETELQAFDMGASEMISKPFAPHVVRRRVQNVIELNLHRLYQDDIIAEQSEKLRKSNDSMIDALTSIIEYRSLETGQHVRRIREFTCTLLERVAEDSPEYGLNEHKISLIVSASSMHDIGKVAIPDSILNKPGRLTQEEYEIMKTHSTKGCEMITRIKDNVSDKEYLDYAYNICRSHHERGDGRGYPDGLKGNEIPICAQVVGIADCYDALTNDRVYKKAIPPQVAQRMILNGECGAFSQRLLKNFVDVGEKFFGLSKEYSDKK